MFFQINCLLSICARFSARHSTAASDRVHRRPGSNNCDHADADVAAAADADATLTVALVRELERRTYGRYGSVCVPPAAGEPVAALIISGPQKGAKRRRQQRPAWPGPIDPIGIGIGIGTGDRIRSSHHRLPAAQLETWPARSLRGGARYALSAQGMCAVRWAGCPCERRVAQCASGHVACRGAL